HKLIREGAHLVERAADIIAVLEGTTQAVPARRFVPAAAVTAAIQESLIESIAPGETLPGEATEPGLFLNASEPFSVEPAASGVAVEALSGPRRAGAAVVPSGWTKVPSPATALEAAAAGLD